ncbi:MAG TPA: DUF2163 domain-containing protein [Croceibacterium sp.]|nr:DUF2163 domain-containing protein [Croceibacterium sp.]
MSRVFNREELEGVAAFWRIQRRDGVTLGLTSHDRDLWFDGVRHRAAPGMLPSAIRRTADLAPDSAEVQGALTHDSIAAADLAAGRFDGAAVEIGVVDWDNLDRAVLYRGEIGGVSEEARGFSAELRSAKADLEADTVPRTSPTCRARFCGPGCTLSLARFTHEAALAGVEIEANRVTFAGIPDAMPFSDGSLRWLDGPHAGATMEIARVEANGLVLDVALDPALAPGARALLREGCDHTLQTCHARFGNAVNFQGEPFLPGNDLIARYPTRSP